MDLANITELAPPVLLVVALNAIGWALKQSAIPNKFIPVFMLCLGGGAYPLIYEKSGVALTSNHPTAYAVILGIALGGAATGCYEAVQAFKKKQPPEVTLPPAPPKL